MIDVNELRKGVTFELDNELYKVIDYHHHKPGRGNATIKIKAKNLRTGTNIEKSFNSGERIQDIRLEYRNVQFLYSDGGLFYFMDSETFEQPAIDKKLIGEYAEYLKEGVEVKLTYYDTEPIDIELPTAVDLKVIRASAAIRGDTATNVDRTVVVETGQEFSVPAFVEEGDIIRVDTRTGQYITRVQE